MIICSKNCTVICDNCIYFVKRYEVCTLTDARVEATDVCENFHCELANPPPIFKRSKSLFEIGLQIELETAIERLKYHTEYTCDRDKENYYQGYVEAIQLVIKIHENLIKNA